MTLIHRRDPSRNMARFYALSVQADLLTGWSLVREWGRIGRPGRVRVDPHAELAIAEMAALAASGDSKEAMHLIRLRNAPSYNARQVLQAIPID